MRNVVTIAIIAVILGTLSWTFYVYFFQQNPINPAPNQPAISATPVRQRQTFCQPQNLDAQLALSPGAGNVWGTFTIKNISQTPCRISGNRFIGVQYDPSVTSISVTHQGQVQTTLFTVLPNQTIYSQVHYPNGPQCNGPVNPTTVTFNYQISPTQSIVFTDTQSGKIQEIVQACSAKTDMTQIQIWNMSTTPITQ